MTDLVTRRLALLGAGAASAPLLLPRRALARASSFTARSRVAYGSVPTPFDPAAFALNRGTGGDFAITGALTLSPDSPVGTQGVEFDGSTWLVNAALASSDNGTASFFAIYRESSTQATNAPYWQVDPTGNNSDGFNAHADGSSTQAFFGDAGGSDAISATAFSVTRDTWHVILASCDVRRGTPVEVIYLDDFSVGQPPVILGTLDGSTTLAFNGLPLNVMYDGTNAVVGGVAALWIAPGVSLLDGSGDIPLATRRKFVSAAGLPVPLGARGELPTGTAPAVYLSLTP